MAFEAEAQEIIRSVPEEERFPCVFLDPAVYRPWSRIFTGERQKEDGVVDIGPHRHDILEVARSFSHHVLRRAGRVLAHLKYAPSQKDLPAEVLEPHDELEISYIPLALALPRYRRNFWRVLPHAFVPGAMFAPRPAALLAALSIRKGIYCLESIAHAELQLHTWSNLEYPQTWTTSCLALLLEADESLTRIKDDPTSSDTGQATILTEEERKLFKALVGYKMLEMNLEVPLTVQIAWRPERTKVALGPLVTCKICQFPRSVTVMAKNGVCSLCDKDACTCPSEEIHRSQNKNNVLKGHKEISLGTWVECSVTDCRSQYVTYNPERPFKPRCHYCRVAGLTYGSKTQNGPTAPTIECKRCRSRIIWPEEYRSPDIDLTTFRCPGCRSSSYSTIIEAETSLKKFMCENGEGWVLKDPNRKIIHPFTGRSLHQIISETGLSGLNDVVILPSAGQSKSLTHEGKLICNTRSIFEYLRGLVNSRRVELQRCILCGENVKMCDIRTACGRPECYQRVCRSCRDNWYRKNRFGRVIDAAALACPFCKRQPHSAIGTIYFNNLIRNWDTIVEESREWVYGWCDSCGQARRGERRSNDDSHTSQSGYDGWWCQTCEQQAREEEEEERRAQAGQDVHVCNIKEKVREAYLNGETIEEVHSIMYCPIQQPRRMGVVTIWFVQIATHIGVFPVDRVCTEMEEF